jgi:putative FmdB family regulatory protein
MPIYGYSCKSCGHTLDALQKIADDPLLDCPECDEPTLKRQLSAPRFRLKGKGWYETDFKNDNQRNLAGDKDTSKPDGDSKDTKDDTKPKEKTTETKSDAKGKQTKKPKSSNDASTA